ncbi:hypothetical protein BZM27_41175 [Paraburkholderia steynii]|uniref:Uncharacterized protein n=1 Tax=Paraburkholderia steynii TaxID=1245441 RepID=A0A4R0X9Y9_9BURK|nr:hypothetical protein BZM27_41175 [Paraburkholderia steynii]
MPHDELKIRCSRISYNKRCALQYSILGIAGARRIEGAGFEQPVDNSGTSVLQLSPIADSAD